MKVSKNSLDSFRKKYASHIVKENDNQILIHCLNPAHADNKRSAVLYKDTGMIVCPVCKKININKVITNIEYNYESRNTNRKCPSFKCAFPINYYESSYYRDHRGDIIFACIENGVVLGLHKRVSNPQGGRSYYFRGIARLRPQSKYITESTTDAIRLYESGIDAGSICSVVNWKSVKENQIYIPQIDGVGYTTGLLVQKQGIIVVWWDKLFSKEELRGKKDICDLNEDQFQKVVKYIKGGD